MSIINNISTLHFGMDNYQLFFQDDQLIVQNQRLNEDVRITLHPVTQVLKIELIEDLYTLRSYSKIRLENEWKKQKTLIKPEVKILGSVLSIKSIDSKRIEYEMDIQSLILKKISSDLTSIYVNKS